MFYTLNKGHNRSRPIFALSLLLVCCASAPALDPSLNVSQYAHTAWAFRDGFPLGNIFAIAQTSDGYLWLGGEFGLFQFDGVRTAPWQPPAGQQLPDRFVFKLLGARDGTLWIATFSGLVTWDGARLIRHPEFAGQQMESLFEDHEGTVWAGTRNRGARPARLCEFRSGGSQCFGDDGALGNAVLALYEDHSGAFWVCAESGLWRWRPGPPRRQWTHSWEISALTETEDGRTLIARYGDGLMQLAGDKLQTHPIAYLIPGPIDTKRLLTDRELDANKLLRDRNGGLWIGTVEHGLVHVYRGRTDVFRKSDGLSGDVVLGMFEDREGNIWVSTTGGLDRFREFRVATISSKQGLTSDAVASVLADRDGSVWIGTHQGLTRWKNGKTTAFRKRAGLPDDFVESLFQDDRGRLLLYAGHELACFRANRFLTLYRTVPGEEVLSITGDNQSNLWLAGNQGLYHLRKSHSVETLPWPALGHSERAKDLLADRGGVWLSFWNEAAVAYFKDGRIRTSYTAADGLGKGRVANLRLDGDGALWAATDQGGLSRITNGRISTLSSVNGLPCDMIHWSIQDNDHSLWLYTGCGLVRIARSELDAWIADPRRRVVSSVLDAADGARLRAVSASSYSPTVARSADGRLFFLAGDSIQMVNPHHLSYNELPPPVHIERIVADHKVYWQQLTGRAASNVLLPPRTRDVQIDYTALSLVAAEKVHFKYKLDRQDEDWREVVNDRQVQYSNLSPGNYRFRVIASNNSGVWNETGDTLEFSIAPAYYQANWFRASMVAAFFLALWGVYRVRLLQISREFNAQLEGRVDERLRLARELHDTLLQSVQGLIPLFQTARNLLPRQADRAAEVLDEGLKDAADAIVEGRNAIQNLRTETSLDPDLGSLLNAAGQELAHSPEADGSAPAFRVVVEGPRRPLAPLIRDECYRIGREVLRNAFRHAHAGQVEAEIRYDRGMFRLRIRDDGKGIDPSILKAGARSGHFGLPGMHERAQEMGARLKIWSEPGAGTEAELTVPSRIAYTKSPPATVDGPSPTANSQAARNEEI